MHFLTSCVHLSPSVLLVLRAAEPAGQLCLPADQQHWQTLPHALHRAPLPPHPGGAQSGAFRQPGPAGDGQRYQRCVSHFITATCLCVVNACDVEIFDRVQMFLLLIGSSLLLPLQ